MPLQLCARACLQRFLLLQLSHQISAKQIEENLKLFKLVKKMQSDEEPYLNRHQSLWNDPTFKKKNSSKMEILKLHLKKVEESLETNPST